MSNLCWGWARVDSRGSRAAGQRAARDALAQVRDGLELAYDGSRPVVLGDRVAISISHGREHAVAVAGRVERLGVDLCELDRGRRIREIASRFATADERALLAIDRDAALLWAAKEAGLKALGLGLLDGVFDGVRVQVASLDPPRYAAPAELVLQISVRDDVVVALAQTPPSTSTVAPFI